MNPNSPFNTQGNNKYSNGRTNYSSPYQQQQQVPQPMFYPASPGSSSFISGVITIILIGAVIYGGIYLLNYMRMEDTFDTIHASTFAQQVTKVVTAAQNQYAIDNTSGGLTEPWIYIYDIQNDLNLTEIEDYKGYVVVDAKDLTRVQYYIYMNDGTLQIRGYNATLNSTLTSDSEHIINFDRDIPVQEICKNHSSIKLCYNRLGESID